MDDPRTTHEMPKTDRDEVPMPEEQTEGEPLGQKPATPGEHQPEANPANPPSERT